MTRSLRMSVLLTAALPLLAACESGKEPVAIGIAGPLQLANGRSMRLAAEMAADQINQRGGIRGRPIALVFEDDGADKQQAIQVATRLRDSTGVVAVVGHVNSSATLAAADIYNQPGNGLPQISPASSSPLVTDAGPWTFRVCPSDLLHGPAVAEWTYGKLGRRRALVLYSNDSYGQGVTETFSDAFQRAGGTVLSRDPYLKAAVQAPGSVDAYLTRALRRGMDALMIAGQADAGMEIVRRARRLGYQGPVLGADGMTGVKDAGIDAEGIYVSSAFLPDRNDPAAQRFVEAYTARYHEQPDHRGAMTYDAVHLIAQAIEAKGASRSAVRDYLERVGRGIPVYDGVSGQIQFDEHGDVPRKQVVMGQVRNGALATVP